ncbi:MULTISPECIES: amidohydrolase family protein [unclassified Pseudofrankia]|uniref:amidohydrolase family protein n=1 Tax=unclassified Pseudofrankia TaxID=2994372 RepID=UPI0008DACA81|nr:MULTISPECIES: amidohydrolase family protein [unclassified Pseudofrankia]MDT3443282.1 amidohydrolase family protein [Pseudofrankia sp. BMG5.37]OHV65375.1 amidohydrolase [Pseudofrankia sp. BMG5.36]
MVEDIILSADGHFVEPTDLFTSRLPKHLRELAVWEEDFEIEPLGEDGNHHFRKLHTPGFEGWAYARYRHHDGTPQYGDPARIIEDLDHEGVRATLMHPNHALFGLFTHDHHELSMAHARVYNDYAAEVFGPYRDRVITTMPIPMSDLDDAVAEIERVAALGARALILPATSPIPYTSRALDRVWAAAQAHGMVIAFHVATGGVKVRKDAAPTLQAMIATAQAQNREVLDDQLIVDRLMGAAVLGPVAAQRIVVSLVGAGVLERFPDLHFLLVEFNANWLVSTMAAMDKAWTLGVGQNRDFWAGTWDDARAADDQPGMAQLFRLNERWPYPLMPSEYVQRQIHVSFQEDPMAIACRHVTGISTLLWGMDYPHAEGTFGRSRQVIDYLFKDVEPEERQAILGGTLGGLLGLHAPSPA